MKNVKEFLNLTLRTVSSMSGNQPHCFIKREQQNILNLKLFQISDRFRDRSN